MATARSKTLIKIGAALAVLAGLGFLFWRSVHDSRSQPYTIAREHLRNWVVAVEHQPGSTAPLLVLRPPPELTSGLFGQVFTRTMETLASPAGAAIPLVLRGEFEGALAGNATPEALAAAARSAGLESASWQPRCLAYRRVSSLEGTLQLYFVVFDAPALLQFRQQIGALFGGGGAPFDPAALSPVLIIASTDSAFNRWLPLRVDPKRDCVAPIVAG